MAALEQDDDDFLVKKLGGLNVSGVDDVDWKPEEDYYVHIDVLHGSSQLVSRRINSYMIRQDAFDPRRVFNFPTDLFEKNDKDTLKHRRELAGVGSEYYELWKVRKTFSLAGFGKMVDNLQKNGKVTVRIVRMIDNDHDINIYPLEPSAAKP
jgi:hypothetical protein